MAWAPTKRQRTKSKTASSGTAEPRSWPWLEADDEAKYSKQTWWYLTSASMLAEYPLSAEAVAKKDEFTTLVSPIRYAAMRPLFNSVKHSPAHSFQYKKKWKSLSAEAMATYYEDAALHAVGEIRMKDWWSCNTWVHRPATGAALTFWFSLDGSPTLPDAIVAGLQSTKLADFEAVFCLTYQQLTNLPAHINVIDANDVLPHNIFLKVLKHGTEKTRGFIAVLAEWIKLA